MNVRERIKFYVGIILFCLGLFLPFLALIVPFLGISLLVKTVLAAIFIVGGPEVFMVLGVVFAGKPTINLIKAKFKSFFLFKPVSRTRHYIGITCLLFSIVAGWVSMYFLVLTDRPIGDEIKLLCLGSIDLIFIASFFILGSPFFQKLTNLFTWNQTP